MKTSLSVLSIALGLGLIALAAEAPRRAPSAAEDMTQAAAAFLGGISPEQQAKAKFDWKDAERVNWHFIPKERKGLPLKEMNADQRKLALALLATGLSAKGLEKATTIMSLEAILKEMEGPNGKMVRDPERYFFSVFGTPDAKGTWGWRCEGHHLSMNFTLVAGKAITATPSFMGSNPGLVKEGARKGLRVLGNDEDMGRAIAKGLSAEQKAGIIATEAPKDVLLMPGKKVELLEPAGIGVSKLAPAQVESLKALVKEYAQRHRAELADQDLAKIEKAGWENVHFAWAGGLEPGEGHYYRVQGPTFVLEYDNTQNNANHVHSVWHDPADNFAADLLKQHYEKDHK